MPENFFNKIKKSFNSFIGISDDNEITDIVNSDNAELNDNKVSDDLIVDTEVTDNSNVSLKQDLPIQEKLSFNINDSYKSFLDNFFQNDNQIISCIIFNKKTLNIQSIYTKIELDKDYIVFLLNDVSNIIVNDKINNLIKCGHIDSLIDKILIVRENDYQYISIIEDTIIVMITNQKNQLITWQNIDKIKEYILA